MKLSRKFKLLKAKIRSKSVVFRPLFYHHLPQRLKPVHTEFHKILYPFFKKTKNLFFIQIGSYDGVSGDPLYGYINKYSKSQGILVEPVPAHFRKLCDNYKNHENLFFENVAISDSEGKKSFYSLDNNIGIDSYRREWLGRLGSLSTESILNREWMIPNIEDHLNVTEVNCITLKVLLKKYNINKFDLLHIDTEGHDYKIIKTIPFEEFKPKIILYEHKHLGTSKEECISYLENLGYSIVSCGHDTLAYTMDPKA